MSNPFNNPFGSSFDDIFGSRSVKKPEKGVPWEAKVIDGEYYVPLAQVAELLKTNGVLPAVAKGIEARVEMARLKKEQGL